MNLRVYTFIIAILLTANQLFAGDISNYSEDTNISPEYILLQLEIELREKETQIDLEFTMEISGQILSSTEDFTINDQEIQTPELQFYKKSAEDFVIFNSEKMQRDAEIEKFLREVDLLAGIYNFKNSRSVESQNPAIHADKGFSTILPQKDILLLNSIPGINYPLNQDRVKSPGFEQIALNIFRLFKYIQTLPDADSFHLKITSFLFSNRLLSAIILLLLFFISANAIIPLYIHKFSFQLLFLEKIKV